MGVRLRHSVLWSLIVRSCFMTFGGVQRGWMGSRKLEASGATRVDRRKAKGIVRYERYSPASGSPMDGPN